MPAIYPARLKTQTAELAECYANPKNFLRGLHNLLEFYSDRTYRPGQSGEPRPLIAQYNVPSPVLRQVLKDLLRKIEKHPQVGLVLCDNLWEQPYLECKQLAVRVLGNIAPEPPEKIFERVVRWGISGSEHHLQMDLVVEGLARLRRERPDVYIHQVGDWLSAENHASNQIGIKALIALLDQSHFANLPAIYRILTPLLHSKRSKLRSDIILVLGMLAKHSPQETAVFIKQNMAFAAEYPEILWFIRHSLRFFPPEIERNLRKSLKGVDLE
ncbi:MAG: DNA alkylation repair protein [Anaerolineales bacterium]|nr:DNA alkylation repair protein [Anaerolineales bacterium]